MIGYYGRAVNLTYMGVISAVIGMFYALDHNMPYAIICLVIAGICDMFDGTVARMTERTEREKQYGVQIDSLADLISFGVFPALIGYSLGFCHMKHMIIFAFYILAALIRLAYYNVTELERTGNEPRTYYEGLPVTSVAIIIPFLYLISLFIRVTFQDLYIGLLPILALAFIVRFHVPKLKLRHMVAMSIIAIPFIVFVIKWGRL